MSLSIRLITSIQYTYAGLKGSPGVHCRALDNQFRQTRISDDRVDSPNEYPN